MFESRIRKIGEAKWMKQDFPLPIEVLGPPSDVENTSEKSVHSSDEV